MSWYAESISGTRYSWLKRRAVAVNNLSGGTTIDVSFVYPTDDDDFWTSINSDGSDIRVVDADGSTKLSYNLENFSLANRVLTVEVDDYAAPENNSINMLWMYFSRSNATSGAAAAFTPVAAKSASAEQACTTPPLVRIQPERPGETSPRTRVSKAAGETIHVWWDIDAILQKRCSKSNDYQRIEEIDYASIAVLNAAGTDQTAMYTAGSTTFSSPGAIRTTIKAGTTGTDYTLSLTVGTTLSRILNPRALLQVRSVSA